MCVCGYPEGEGVGRTLPVVAQDTVQAAVGAGVPVPVGRGEGLAVWAWSAGAGAWQGADVGQEWAAAAGLHLSHITQAHTHT